eukprot:2831400-Rhodomonas_salina.1
MVWNGWAGRRDAGSCQRFQPGSPALSSLPPICPSSTVAPKSLLSFSHLRSPQAFLRTLSIAWTGPPLSKPLPWFAARLARKL